MHKHVCVSFCDRKISDNYQTFFLEFSILASVQNLPVQICFQPVSLPKDTSFSLDIVTASAYTPCLQFPHAQHARIRTYILTDTQTNTLQLTHF